MTSAQARTESVAASSFEIQKLDWLKATIIGLTDREITILKYIADVDEHRADAMRDVLATQVPAHSASMAFLTLWNNEEIANCQDMAELMMACGVDLTLEREKTQPAQSRLQQWLGHHLRRALGRLVPRTARALQLTWAASQKLMLTLVYERLAATTKNPILRVLCNRIAKQERRNFFWYYNAARAVLLKARGGHAIVRLLMNTLWYPLCGLTPSRQAGQALLASLWAGESLHDAMTRLDEAIAQLPGLEATTFAERCTARSPRELPHLSTLRALLD